MKNISRGHVVKWCVHPLFHGRLWRWFQREQNVRSRRLIRGKYICTRHVLWRKSISRSLEYVYAERRARFRVTQKRLRKIFKRDGPGSWAARGCLFAFVASRDNGKRKPDASSPSTRRSFHPFFFHLRLKKSRQLSPLCFSMNSSDWLASKLNICRVNYNGAKKLKNCENRTGVSYIFDFVLTVVYNPPIVSVVFSGWIFNRNC